MPTSDLNFITPVIGSDDNTWGQMLNDNWEQVDGELTDRMRRDMLTFDGNPDEFTGTVAVYTNSWNNMIQLKNSTALDTVWPVIGSDSTGHIQMSHGDDPTTVAARIDPNGTALSGDNSVVTKEKLDAFLGAYVEAMHPVGTIHMSASSANPSTYFGFGTWVAHAEGRALVGVGTADARTWAVNQEYGTDRHLLTESQIPSHSHNVDAPLQSFDTNSQGSNHTHDTNPNAFTTDSQNSSHTHDTNIDYFDAGAGSLSSGSTYRVLLGNSNNASGSTDINSKNQNSGHAHTFNLPAKTSTTASSSHDHSVDVNLSAFNSGTTGGGNDHNNVQPSIGIYVWRRTA